MYRATWHTVWRWCSYIYSWEEPVGIIWWWQPLCSSSLPDHVYLLSPLSAEVMVYGISQSSQTGPGNLHLKTPGLYMKLCKWGSSRIKKKALRSIKDLLPCHLQYPARVEHQYPNSPHPVRHHDDMGRDVPQHQTSHSLQCSEQLTL